MSATHGAALAAALLLTGLAATAPTASAQVFNPPCARALYDLANPRKCIAASSVPEDGALLPLGSHWFVLPTGEVGIGTKTPEHRLHVAGDLKVDGRLAVGGDSRMGPTGVWDQLFSLAGSITDFSTSQHWQGMHSWITLDPAKDLTTGPDRTDFYSHTMATFTEADNDKNIYYVQGPYLGGFHLGTGEVEFLGGVGLLAESFGEISGQQVGAYVYSDAAGTGSIPVNTGINIRTGHRGTAGVVDSNYGLYLFTPATARPVMNHYGIFLEDQDVAGGDSYSIYSEGGTNYLAGDVGIGEPNPSVALHVDGDFAATGTKSFVQPHPYDPSREIWFVCLEGNEAGTYFRGTADLQDGRAVIPVPEEFAMTTSEAGLTVQLTAMGPDAGLWVESVDLDWVVVRGKSDVKFSYMINGIRYGYADFESIRFKEEQRPNLVPPQRPSPVKPMSMEGR